MSQLHVYRTEAIVLRRQDFGEADRVLTLYSPWRGKFRAIAKGVRRPKSRLGGNVELFTHVNLLVAQGRNLDLVTQAEAIRPFGRIRDDLWKTSYACYVAELVDRFTEDHLENQPIFDLLLQALTYLDEAEASPEPTQPAGISGAAVDGVPGTVQPPSRLTSAPREVRERRQAGDPGSVVEMAMRNFELRLLGHLGYAPELIHCTQCHDRLVEGENRFSPAGGGVLCANCAALHPGGRILSVNAIKAMRVMSQQPFGIFHRLRLAPDHALEVEGALRAHINFILERQLRTSEFLDRMKADRKRERRQATLATS